jgi:hypothetical protein
MDGLGIKRLNYSLFLGKTRVLVLLADLRVSLSKCKCECKRNRS